MKEGPILSRAKQCAGEDNAMERDVILPNELVEVNILRVLPPQFPVFHEVRSDRWIANRRIKPYVHHFMFPTRERHRRTPLQVSSDATVTQTSLDPSFRSFISIVTPVPVLRALINESIDLPFKLR